MQRIPDLKEYVSTQFKREDDNPYNFPPYNRNIGRVVNECTHKHNPIKGNPKKYVKKGFIKRGLYSVVKKGKEMLFHSQITVAKYIGCSSTYVSQSLCNKDKSFKYKGFKVKQLKEAN